MSDVIEAAVAALSERLVGGFDAGTAKFVLGGEGAIIVDANGVRAGTVEDAADVTLTAETEVFQDIIAGLMNPTTAFMSGKLTVEGDMGMAMQLGSTLA